MAANSEEVEEDVVGVVKLKKSIRDKLPAPMKLDEAVDTAIANGCTIAELTQRAVWFGNNQKTWKSCDLPGVLYLGLLHAWPGMQPDQGWPHMTPSSRKYPLNRVQLAKEIGPW